MRRQEGRKRGKISSEVKKTVNLMTKQEAGKRKEVVRQLGKGRERRRGKKNQCRGGMQGNCAKVWEVRVDGIAVNQQQRANAEILSGGLSKIKFLFVLKALLG